jgi:hypothetical protein
MQKWYIYFDSLGKIYAVTNEKKESGTFIETAEENVKDFITGKKKFENFIVNFDNSKTYNLKEKQNLESLKFCNLENFTKDKIESIDFNMYTLQLYECMENNYNFLQSIYEVQTKEHALDLLKSNTDILFRRLLRNE